MRELRLLCAIAALLISSAYSFASDWKWVGPPAGNVQQIVPDRRHPAVWYAINDNRLYRSSDSLKSWQSLKLNYVYFLAIHPKTSRLYVLTNESYRTKLWSIDDGTLTIKLIASFEFELRSIYLHPLNQDLLYATGFQESDLSVSTDGGHHWQLLPKFPYKLQAEYKGCSVGNIETNDLLIPPFNATSIYVSGIVNIYCPQAYGEEYTEDASWVSKDSGTHWSVLGDQPNGFHVDALFPDRAFFFASENGTRVLKILTKTGTTLIGDAYPYLEQFRSVPRHPNELLGRLYFQKFVRSVDGGKTWKEMNIRLAAGVNDYQTMDDPFRGIAIATYGGGVYERNDNHSWQSANNGFRASNATRVLADSKNAYALIGEDFKAAEFFYRSSDQGKTWTDLSMKTLAPIAALAQDPFNPHHILLGGGKRILSSYDDGNTWYRSSLHSPYLYSLDETIQFDPNHRDVLYACVDAYVFKSSDSGKTFSRLATLPYALHFSRMVIDPNKTTNLYFVTDFGGIFKSQDSGKTVHAVNNGLPKCCADCGSTCGLDVIPLGLQDTFLASVQDDTEDSTVLYKTVDGGKTWARIGKIPGIFIYSADPMGNHLYTAGGARFAESTDGGLNWTKINLGRQIFAEWLSDPSRLPLFAATTRGVYVKEN